MSSRPLSVVTTPAPRVDAVDKVRGTARYVDDLSWTGMLHAKVLTSSHAHAEVLSIDVSEAARSEGVFAVLTAKDIPGENQIGVSTADQPLLVARKARMMADRIALIAADTPEHAAAAAAKVQVRYAPLPVVSSVEEALRPDAPLVHEGGNLLAKKQVIKGDIAQGFRESVVVVEGEYETGYQEHAYLENNGVVAVPEGDGGITLYASAQCPFYIQKAVARVLGKELAAVRCVQTTTGGAFGGKEDYPSEPAACAALLAMKTGRPVKLVYDRREDILWSSKRHPMRVRHRLGFDADARLVACEIRIDCDAGAYNGLSAVVAERANATAPGPYRVPHVRVDTFVVYTNNLFGGAFRGFGSPQVTFAMEAQLDEAAARFGLSPAELRRRNLLKVGDETATGQLLPESVGGVETLEAAVARSDFEARSKALAEFNAKSPFVKRGIGLGCCMYGCCLHAGGQFLEGSGALLQVLQDGSVSVAIGGTELGQGAFTAVAQLAAEALGCALKAVRVGAVDTALVPDSGPTVASRTTVMSGNAVLDAAQKLAVRLREAAAQKLGVEPERVRAQDGWFSVDGGIQRLSFAQVAKAAYERKVNLAAEGWFTPPRKEWNEALGRGEAYSVYCFAAQVVEVEVDLRTGAVRVERVTAAHDVGRAVNPAGVVGQIEGGVVQGMGYALMEELKVVDGKCLNPGFTDYLIPSAPDAPAHIESVLVELPWSLGPYGAKGIGEPALIPIAAAIANAVSFACGHRFRRLPLTPERLVLSLADEAGRPVAG